MYAEIAQMARDRSLLDRITACAAVEGKSSPELWTDLAKWRVVASPGWADAWASAIAAGRPNPGLDETVITDQAILSAVQSIRARGA